jgi:hypothetical protein
MVLCAEPDVAPVPEPEAVPTVEEPTDGEAPVAGDDMVEDEPAEPGCMLPAVPGCIAGEPIVAEPDPDATGRSVALEEVVLEVWARAGAATKAVATRHAAKCFFSIFYS